MSNYWIMAELKEPDYEAEAKYLAAELKYVERMLHSKAVQGLGQISLPSLGIFGHKDWRHYEHELRGYAQKLQKYARGVEEGVLPVKFSVYNNTESTDSDVTVKLKVANGRVDELRKVPKRPARLDAHAKPWKPKFPPLGLTFSRSQIKITAHGVGAKLSALGPHDGAALVNQVVHIHCSPETEVTYAVTSRNVEHETGAVEIN
jgi:hypothetical protein